MEDEQSVDFVFEMGNVNKISHYDKNISNKFIENYKEFFSFKYQFQEFMERIKYSFTLENKVA